jgi:hydroxylaminobenzene mutase
MEKNIAKELLRHGLLLLLIGLLTGVAIPAFTNPRMGLAAHLGAVLNGMLLIVLSLAWTRIGIAGRLEKSSYGLLLYGTYSIWAANALAAIFGTSWVTPLAGAGHEGTVWQEVFVTILITTGAVAVLVATVFLVYTVWRK